MGVSEKEATKLGEELKSISTQSSEVDKTSKTQYVEKDRMRICRYASLHGYRQSVRHFANEFPRLNESSIRRWTSTCKSQLVQQQTEENIIIGLKRGRPTLYHLNSMQKMRTMIQNFRISGAPINIHTVHGVLAGLVRSDVEKYGQYLDFQVKRPWVRSLYHRTKMSRRVSTTSRPIITRALWEEISTQYLHEFPLWQSLMKSLVS